MESILSMHDEIYPVKSRRTKSSAYSTTSLHIRRNTLNNTTNIFSVFYQYIRKMVAQRTLYILGVLNLILAGIAVVCVTHAEDHPEYFSLVYIAIAIFSFYMVTIFVIIILQIIETYQERQQRNHLSSSIQIPFITSQMATPSNPLIVESMINKTQITTRLSRSCTLPLIHADQTFINSASPSLLKDFNPIKSSRFTLFPKTNHINLHFSRNYQQFPLTTNDQFSPS